MVMSEGASRRRWFRRAMGVAVGALGVLGFGPASLLVLVGETRPGRLFGGVAAGVLVAAVGLAVVRVRGAPETRPDRDSGLISRFMGGAGVPRLSPLGLVPEIDQVKLGLTMATRFVPWVGRARTIREVMMGFYREIEAEP